MNFGIYSYTATVLIFTGGAGPLYLAASSVAKRNALPWKYWRIILFVMLGFTLCTSPGERFALLWRTWEYNPAKSFHVTFLGAEVETYVFAALVGLVVSLATLAFARREDRKRFLNTTLQKI